MNDKVSIDGKLMTIEEAMKYLEEKAARPKIEKSLLGLAAEYAVASELCRRNIYAQLTLGPRKRTDILVETETGMLRIQVKGKQGKEWPGVKGIYGKDAFLIFVDFEGKSDQERPDFYILTVEDWEKLLEKTKKRF